MHITNHIYDQNSFLLKSLLPPLHDLPWDECKQAIYIILYIKIFTLYIYYIVYIHISNIYKIFQTTLNEFEAVPPIIASDPVFREIVKNEEAEEKEQVYILYTL